MRLRQLVFLAGLAASLLVAPWSPAADPDQAGVEYFEKHVRPILVEHCFECHAGDKVKGGLRLDSRRGWSTGGDSGPAIVPGQLDDSLLIQAVRYGGDYEMPPQGKLPDKLIRALEQWVERGAPDPRRDAASEVKPAIDIAAGRDFWSYRPLSAGSLPQVQDANWPRTSIDMFILDRLAENGLQPAAEADRSTLVRRLYFDLHGLPPTADEMDAFLADPRPDAYERLVDRLLASPRFGERWGRHWLDIARFAESTTLRGFVFKEAWRYRDYVIDVFNHDRPFDQFIREQIAGDLLPAESDDDRERKLVATTYLTLGNTNLEEQDKKQLDMDVVDEQLDVISKGLLAQTVTCARCHDHKFDPIPQRDYYALAGILANTRMLDHANVSKWIEVPLPVEPELAESLRRHEELVAALQQKVNAAKRAVKLAAALPEDPNAQPLVLAVADLPGIVIDDQQAKRVGEWKESQFTKRYIGDGYLHDLNEQHGQKTLTFSPELPRDGKYEVRFAYTPAENRAQSAQLTVFSADGEKTITIDQTDPPPIDGRFVSLGEFRFERAGQSFVILSNEKTTGYVCADAVQFLPADDTATVSVRAVTAAAESPARRSQEQLSAAEAELKRLEAEMKKLAAAAPYRPMAMSVVEQKEIQDGQILIRGIVHNPGETVPRGFLQVCGTDSLPSLPSDQSGRKELADWLSSPDNPLTARVLVNRIWHVLFGAGIVRTVDNFGTTGELPSHPELLDHLAVQFIQSGWSVKELVRHVVLSSTYRQGSTVPDADAQRGQAADPENRLLWRMNRRRLDAESLRDAMLSVSGELRLETEGPAFPSELADDYAFQHSGTRRSVYEPVFRNSLLEILQVFDFADPSLVTGGRSTSTVAPQALFLMNHPFVLDRSQQAADRILLEPADDDADRLRRLFRRALGRLPGEQELQTSLAFLSQAGAEGRSSDPLQSWAQICQTLFSSIDFRYIE